MTTEAARAVRGSASISRLWNPTLARSLSGQDVRLDLELLFDLPTLQHLTVFPDVLAEPPGIGVPVGVAFTTSGADALVLPNGVTDANDGYRIEQVEVQAGEVLDAAERIIDAVATLRRPLAVLTEKRAREILEQGLAALVSGGADGELDCVWDRGRVPVDDSRSIGPDALVTLRHTFGTFGRYGHFLELLEVESVLSDRCPLERGAVVLLVHCGAMEVSDIVYLQGYFDVAEAAAPLDLVSGDHFRAGMFGLPLTHPVSARFADATHAVTNAAYAWRREVARRACAAISPCSGVRSTRGS